MILFSSDINDNPYEFKDIYWPIDFDDENLANMLFIKNTYNSFLKKENFLFSLLEKKIKNKLDQQFFEDPNNIKKFLYYYEKVYKAPFSSIETKNKINVNWTVNGCNESLLIIKAKYSVLLCNLNRIKNKIEQINSLFINEEDSIRNICEIIIDASSNFNQFKNFKKEISKLKVFQMEKYIIYLDFWNILETNNALDEEDFDFIKNMEGVNLKNSSKDDQEKFLENCLLQNEDAVINTKNMDGSAAHQNRVLDYERTKKAINENINNIKEDFNKIFKVIENRSVFKTLIESTDFLKEIFYVFKTMIKENQHIKFINLFDSYLEENKIEGITPFESFQSIAEEKLQNRKEIIEVINSMVMDNISNKDILNPSFFLYYLTRIILEQDFRNNNKDGIPLESLFLYIFTSMEKAADIEKEFIDIFIKLLAMYQEPVVQKEEESPPISNLMPLPAIEDEKTQSIFKFEKFSAAKNHVFLKWGNAKKKNIAGVIAQVINEYSGDVQQNVVLCSNFQNKVATHTMSLSNMANDLEKHASSMEDIYNRVQKNQIRPLYFFSIAFSVFLFTQRKELINLANSKPENSY